MTILELVLIATMGCTVGGTIAFCRAHYKQTRDTLSSPSV